MRKVRQGQHEGVQLVHGAVVGVVVSGGERDGAHWVPLWVLLLLSRVPVVLLMEKPPSVVGVVSAGGAP